MVPELQGIDGVSEATVTGTRDEVVVITPDVKKLAAHRLSPTAVAEALRANGQPVPAGSLTEDQTSLTVQVGSRITRSQELKDLYLTPAAAPQAAPQSPQRPYGAGAAGRAGAAAPAARRLSR